MMTKVQNNVGRLANMDNQFLGAWSRAVADLRPKEARIYSSRRVITWLEYWAGYWAGYCAGLLGQKFPWQPIHTLP